MMYVISVMFRFDFLPLSRENRKCYMENEEIFMFLMRFVEK